MLIPGLYLSDGFLACAGLLLKGDGIVDHHLLHCVDSGNDIG